MCQSRKILNRVIQDFTEGQMNALRLLVVHGYTHLGCKGTISKKPHGLIICLQSACYLSSMCQSIICLYTYCSLSIYHLSIYLSTTFLSIIFLFCIYLSTFVYPFLFICQHLCIYVYTFISAICVSRHYLSIHLSLIHPSINALKNNHLSVHLPMHPITIYHIFIIYILIEHYSVHRFMC